jgi:hypothetical protein
MKRHPKVHPHDVLNYLYHAPMHRPKPMPTQNGCFRRRVRRDDATTKFPEVHANVRSGCRRAGRGNRVDSRTMLEKNDEVLCRVERKVLDAHAEVVHDEPRLARGVARQPRGDQPSRRPKLLQRLG